MKQIWHKVNVRGKDECWNWTGKTKPDGYGYVIVGNETHGAHRFAFLASGGILKPGQELDHLCKNRKCCNPAHLEAVSHRENCLRGNSITAINAKKSKCKRGHPLSGDNLMSMKAGGRRCRTCTLNRMRKWRANNRERIRESKKQLKEANAWLASRGKETNAK